MFAERTSVGLDVHARSVAAAAIDGVTGEIFQARLSPAFDAKLAFKTWLAQRPQAWRDAVEVVAMDGFTGFKTATAEELPQATAVMAPFHVVRLAGDALDQCRRRVQQALHGHRGRAGEPLFRGSSQSRV